MRLARVIGRELSGWSRRAASPILRSMKSYYLLLAAFGSTLPYGEAPRDPGLTWWADRIVEKKRVFHVISGGLLTDRHMGVPLLKVPIPADWQLAARTTGGDARLTGSLGETTVLKAQGGERATYQPKSCVIVAPLAGLDSKGSSTWLRTVPEEGLEVYLIEETREQDRLHVEIFGLDGWPQIPVRVSRFDRVAAPEQIACWQHPPRGRGTIQPGLVSGSMAATLHLLDDGLEESLELCQ